jgi:L,D-transpeptidase YcbB
MSRLLSTFVRCVAPGVAACVLTVTSSAAGAQPPVPAPRIAEAPADAHLPVTARTDELPPHPLQVLDDEPEWWDEDTRTWLEDFYGRTLHQPAWFRGGRLTGPAGHLREALHRAPEDGITADALMVQAVERVMASPRPPRSHQELLRADTELTAAFFVHAAMLAHGPVDPGDVHRLWRTGTRTFDLPTLLLTALVDGDLQRAFAALRPVHPEYAHLREALRQYRALEAAGGWPELPTGVLLRHDPAATDETGTDTEVEATRLLRQALTILGDLPAAGGEGTGPVAADGVMDERLEAAVRRFQARHGLDVDGIVGPVTIAAINVPVAERIEQIVINMDRWRWLPEDLGEQHVRVNVPGFRLYAYEGGARRLDMRVVVGRDVHQTPVFSDAIAYLVFSPYWEVPDSITHGTLLPKILDDPAYIQRQRFEVVEGWQEGAERIPPDEIDWDLKAESFPYRLRQRPGPRNAMGQVKFMFPNRFNVYLHDTPAEANFERADRALSHGCVRVEHPVALADWLLRAHETWNTERIEAAMGRRSPRSVRLAEPVPVHLLYVTAWMDEAGVMQFRDDLYGHDAAHAALRDGVR